MKIKFYFVPVLSALVAVVSAGRAQATAITVAPSILDVSPGGTNGFGFSFMNDNSGFAVLDQTSLVQFVQGYGTYTDFIGSQASFVIAAPGKTVSQTYNAANGTGAGQYTFLNSVQPKTIVQAKLVFIYDVYSVDPNAPNFDSIADYLSSEQLSANVTIEAPAAALEPADLELCVTGLFPVTVIWLIHRRKKYDCLNAAAAPDLTDAVKRTQSARWSHSQALIQSKSSHPGFPRAPRVPAIQSLQEMGRPS
jgi:hypothetical protein